MSNNPKFPRRVVKKRLSINWGRFTVFYTVLCSISVIIGLLAHKIIVQGKEANIQKNLAVREKIVKKQHPTLHTSPRIGVVTQDNQQVFGENSYKQQNNTNPESSPPSVVVKPVVKETPVTINQFDNPTQIEQIRLLPPFDYGQPEIVYNSKQPNFIDGYKLGMIVQEIQKLVISKNLPVNNLSVSLIDLSSKECCEYAGFQHNELRFPASVAKMFWMVNLYGLYHQKKLLPTQILNKHLVKMIKDSDNESASFIVDKITKTESTEKELPQNKFQIWHQKRQSLNGFFAAAGYQNLNISQKLFPISSKKNHGPIGSDLQMRAIDNITNSTSSTYYRTNSNLPIRNYNTTYNTARLLLEIETGNSISKRYSGEMKNLLTRSLKKQDWEKIPFNHIQGFLGEGLPENAKLASKMGWNSKTRNDAAIIVSPDGKAKYILVVFGDHPKFYHDKKILPEISKLVYKLMNQL